MNRNQKTKVRGINGRGIFLLIPLASIPLTLLADPTNNLPAAQATAEAAQTTFNAWHFVALGVGAAVTQIYHAVVNAGGVKELWREFWNGKERG